MDPREGAAGYVLIVNAPRCANTEYAAVYYLQVRITGRVGVRSTPVPHARMKVCI